MSLLEQKSRDQNTLTRRSERSNVFQPIAFEPQSRARRRKPKRRALDGKKLDRVVKPYEDALERLFNSEVDRLAQALRGEGWWVDTSKNLTEDERIVRLERGVRDIVNSIFGYDYRQALRNLIWHATHFGWRGRSTFDKPYEFAPGQFIMPEGFTIPKSTQVVGDTVEAAEWAAEWAAATETGGQSALIPTSGWTERTIHAENVRYVTRVATDLSKQLVVWGQEQKVVNQADLADWFVSNGVRAAQMGRTLAKQAYSDGWAAKTVEQAPRDCFEWRLGAVVTEHCPDCLRRDGNVYSTAQLRSIGYPGTGQTQCFSNCKCSLEQIDCSKVAGGRSVGGEHFRFEVYDQDEFEACSARQAEVKEAPTLAGDLREALQNLDQPKLQEGPLAAVLGYAGKARSFTVNADLRGGIIKEEYRDFVKWLDEATNAGRTTSDMLVLRRIGGDARATLPDNLDDLVGKAIVDRGFMSTSMTAEAQHFAGRNYEMVITVPKGSKGVSVDLAGATNFEQEFVIPRNAILRFDGHSAADPITDPDLTLLKVTYVGTDPHPPQPRLITGGVVEDDLWLREAQSVLGSAGPDLDAGADVWDQALDPVFPDPDQEMALNLHSDNKLNKLLRDADGMVDDIAALGGNYETLAERIEDMDDLLNRTRVWRDITVWRGATVKDIFGGLFPDQLVGKNVIDRGLLSTSARKPPALQAAKSAGRGTKKNSRNAPVVMQIHVSSRPNAHAMWADRIMMDDVWPDEVILPRDTGIRIFRADWNEAQKVWEVEAKVMWDQ